MDDPTEKDLRQLSKAKRDLLICLVLADVFEFGNNYYKRKLEADRKGDPEPKFEAPENTLAFLSGRKFASVPSLQAALDLLGGLIATSQFNAASIYGRNAMHPGTIL